MNDHQYIKKGSLVRLSYGHGGLGWNSGCTLDSGDDPRYNPGVVVAAEQYAITVIWPGVADPETWASEVLELLS